MGLISVVTGDIVNSRSIAAQDYDSMLFNLRQTLEWVKDLHGISYEVFRGDSFQATFRDPLPAVRNALYIKMQLLAVSKKQQPWNIRLAIGIGEYQDIRHDSGTSTGEAYELSGRGLDLMKNSDIGVFSNHSSFNQQLELPTKFLIHLLSTITPKQAGAIAAYIQSNFSDHGDVARIIGGSRSNASKLLRRSGSTLIRDYILLCEKHIKRITT